MSTISKDFQVIFSIKIVQQLKLQTMNIMVMLLNWLPHGIGEKIKNDT